MFYSTGSLVIPSEKSILSHVLILPSEKSFLETTSTQNMVLYQQLVNVNILYIVNLLIHNLCHLNSYCLDWTGYEIIFDFVWILTSLMQNTNIFKTFISCLQLACIVA